MTFLYQPGRLRQRKVFTENERRLIKISLTKELTQEYMLKTTIFTISKCKALRRFG